MNEWEWLQSDEPLRMLEWIATPTERKLRLFECGCCRLVWDQLADPRSRAAVAVAERRADGLVTEAEAKSARKEAHYARVADPRPGPRLAHMLLAPERSQSRLIDISFESRFAEEYERGPYPEYLTNPHNVAQADLVRDLFGNPFQPVVWEARWFSADVMDLARAMYEERSFEGMPILGDALMDAGCESEMILDHCRSSTRHVLGCWVVDLILGKS